MQRGEVWWVDFDERRLVVLLSGEAASGFRAMQVVAPADIEISGIAAEVAVGVPEGLPLEGVCASHSHVQALSLALGWPP